MAGDIKEGVVAAPPESEAAVDQEAIEQRSWLLRSGILQNELLPILFSLAAVAVAFQLQSHFFLTSRNLENLVVQITPLALLALGEVMVLLIKEIDLSLGSIAGLAAAICASLIMHHEYAWWTAILITLMAGAGMGAIQGLVVVVGRVPSFVVTLGGYLVWLGFMLQLLGPGGGITVVNPTIANITISKIAITPAAIVVGAAIVLWLVARLRSWRSSHVKERSIDGLAMIILQAVGMAIALILAIRVFNKADGVPVCFVITVGIIGAVAIALKHLPSGRHLYAIGGNTEAARRAGIKVKTIRWAAFVLAGVFAAAAGVLYLSLEQGAGTLTGGGTTLLEAVGAAVVGGVSLFGGRGTAWAALFGALVLGGVDNGLDLTSHAESTKYVVQGLVVIVAVLLDSAIRHYGQSGSLFRLPPFIRRVGSTE